MGGFNILVKFQRGVYSTLLQSLLNNRLLVWRKKDVSSSSLEVLVSSEVANEQGHELGILLGKHTFLEVGKSFGKTHGLAAGIVWTAVLFGA